MQDQLQPFRAMPLTTGSSTFHSSSLVWTVGAGRRRHSSRLFTTRTQPDVLGRWSQNQPEPAAVCAASQLLRRHSALGMVMVWRHILHVEDTRDADHDGHQCRPKRRPLLGHRHRWLRAYEGIYGRTLRSLVPVRRILSFLPVSWSHMATAPPLGMEHRELWPLGTRHERGGHPAQAGRPPDPGQPPRSAGQVDPLGRLRSGAETRGGTIPCGRNFKCAVGETTQCCKNLSILFDAENQLD